MKNGEKQSIGGEATITNQSKDSGEAPEEGLTPMRQGRSKGPEVTVGLDC